MKILICGIGVVGSHIYEEFKQRNEMYLYDKYNEEYNADLDKHYDAAFVCVPTEKKDDGSVDISEVQEIVSKIDADVIIIKSTIPVGTSRGLNKDNVVMSPETYGATQHALNEPDFAILGGLPEITAAAAEVYKTVKSAYFRFQFIDWETAELSKYMLNCWLATKITFCCEFADIAKDFGVDYNKLRECFIMDERISPSHTFVYKDTPYYDSHCFNKDVPGLVSQTEKAELVKTVMNINAERKKANELSR